MRVIVLPILLFFVLGFKNISCAQNTLEKRAIIPDSEKIPLPLSINYTVEPQFPGGMSALMRFINQHLRYPQEALKNQIQGKVFMSFVIDTLGYGHEATIMRGLGYGCDEEALRITQLINQIAWKPGHTLAKKYV